MTTPKDKKLLIVASFEDASIMRKFTILFLVASVIPMVILYYLYTQSTGTEGCIDLPETSFSMVLIFIVIGVWASYLSLRSLLIKVINITRENRKALEGFLSPETLQELNKDKNEIVMLSRSFSAVTKQLEDNIRSLQAAKKTLQSVMAKVGHGISNMENIDSFLQLIVETTTNALNGKAGTLMLLNEGKTELTIKTVYGAPFANDKPVHIQVAGSAFAKIIDEKTPGSVSGKPLEAQFFDGQLLCAPLIYHDRVSGLLTISRQDAEAFSDEDKTLVFNLATQTAVALENSKLNRDIEKTYFETISALALAVDAKDKYSRGHLDRVAEYTFLIGTKLGLNQTDLNLLRDAARLHDLGKIGIPDEILRKEGALSEEEWIIMKRHPEIGESIIKPIRSLEPLCDIIRHHHEKLDGTGYPDGLKGDQISLLVRILTVSDVYDALNTERPYRRKHTKQETAQIMRSMVNHLDQKVVEILLSSLQERGHVTSG